MVVGVLQVDMHIPDSHSLKEKRSVVKSLKDQLRGRFNVAVAELDANDTWQRATLGCSALGNDRAYVERLLDEVTEWLRATRLVHLIQVE
ncbi:MAG: DUF503 domain-containing protein, partial [Candidatus Omnitrophica bacterium]|nr:DUF503 domain-containing protein [Candidatus Omnitrophota bacterium]